MYNAFFSLLLPGLVFLLASCRTTIPGPPDLPAAPTSEVPPKTLRSNLICIYCSDPKVRQRHTDSARWGRWHSGWNISESPVVFAFFTRDFNFDAHTPAHLIRYDYFTASFASRRKKTLGSNPDPLAKAKNPHGKVKTGIKMPEWKTAPSVTPRVYPQLTSYEKFRRAAEVNREYNEAVIDAYTKGLQACAAILATDALYLNSGDMCVSYHPDESCICFNYTSNDSSVRYHGRYELKFVTEDSGTAVLYTRCRNTEIEVQPMTFRIVPMNFVDRWLYP